MNKYLQFGSFLLVVALFVGCGKKVGTAPPATDVELQEQAQEMDASAMDAMSGGNYPGYDKSSATNEAKK